MFNQNSKDMDKKRKYAEYLQEKYESEEWYNEMSFEEFIRMEVATCDPLSKEAVMESCESEETAIDEFIHLCEYLYK